MLCHVCGEPAVGQCQLCREFYCGRHGRRFCVHCREVALRPVEAAPPNPEAAETHPAAVPAADGPCVHCGRPASRTCPLCGGRFCGEHRGWQEVRIGRFKLRRPVCTRCAIRRRRLPAPMIWLFAMLIAGAVSVLVYLLLTADS